MKSWTVLEWIVFAPYLVWAISTNVALRQHYKHVGKPALPANATAMTQLTSIAVVAIVGYPPFHLLWLLAISHLTGFFALRSRFFGHLAWLYGYAVAYTVPSNSLSMGGVAPSIVQQQPPIGDVVALGRKPRAFAKMDNVMTGPEA
jgi:hypothetical protein